MGGWWSSAIWIDDPHRAGRSPGLFIVYKSLASAIALKMSRDGRVPDLRHIQRVGTQLHLYSTSEAAMMTGSITGANKNP
jgi:hypothetical protein